MHLWKTASAAALIACVPQPALAESRVIQAVQIGRETVRYDQGVPTLDLKQRTGAVQVTPLGIEHGNLVFGVAVYNDGPLPATFDRGNISVTSGGMPVPVLSPETLASKAKSRSIWRMVALAAVGGVAAVASANQTDTYRTRVRTPRGGTYRITQTGPSAAGRFNAALITAGTGAGIASMQAKLDDARMRIGAETLQLTTVDPGTSYGGRVTLARLKPSLGASQIAIHVDWNGEGYDFAFRLASKGTPAPVFAAPVSPMLTPAVLPTVEAPTPRPIQAVVTPAAPKPTMVTIAAASAAIPAPVVVAVVPPVAPAPVVVAVAKSVAPTPVVAVAAPRAAPTPMVVAVVQPLKPLPATQSIVAMTAPVRFAAAPMSDYEAKLAAARGVRGRESKQGWTISD